MYKIFTFTWFQHTDLLCQTFSKIVLMAKLLQNNLNLNDFEYSRYLKARKIAERPKTFFKQQTIP